MPTFASAPLPDSPALELVGLEKSFGAARVLGGVDLVVKPGEFCVLLGPSGCGKSTALRCVAGLERPSAGDIRINGKSVVGLEPKARNIAMVFQSYALYPHMSVRQNLEFPLKMAQMPTTERHARVQRAAEFLRIGELLDRKPRQLSGGQRQRVAIGRAIVREPAVFLFDEPLSNLDAALRNDMRIELARLHRRLTTAMLYVTHDQVEAMTLADKLVVMHGGHIEQIGTPSEVYDAPATRFVAGFVGMPGMNVASGTVDADGFSTADGRCRCALKSPHRGPATLGVRPEHARLIPIDEAKTSNAHWQPLGAGCIELIENLGADRFAHIALHSSADANDTRREFVVRLDPSAGMREGLSTTILVETPRLHLFDKAGRRISALTAAS